MTTGAVPFALASTVTNGVNSISSQISSVQTQLSTGQKTLSATDQGVVTRLTAQANGYTQAANNISNAQNVINVAQSGLTSIASIVGQLQTLANKATGTTTSTADRKTLNDTFASLLKQIDSLANNASLNGANLLTSSATNTGLNIQTGLASTDTTSVVGVSANSAGLQLSGLSVSTITAAAAAITTLASALDSLSNDQAALSASGTGLASQGSNANAIATNLQNSINSITTPDANQLQLQLQNLNNQQTINYYLITQMNSEAQAQLKIFQ